jgi:hypothetical protein
MAFSVGVGQAKQSATAIVSVATLSIRFIGVFPLFGTDVWAYLGFRGLTAINS